MSRFLTPEDKRLVLSRWLSTSLKIQILNGDETVLDELIGFTNSGTISIDASSHSRRVYNFTLMPIDESINVLNRTRDWIHKTAKVSIGLKTPRDTDYRWYPCGKFIFTNTTGTISLSENSLSVNCGDLYKLLDGTCNGQLNALHTLIPAYEEDTEGNPSKHAIIREVLFTILHTLGGIGENKMQIDDIGEYKGLPQHNQDYENYRQEHPQWNCLPHDLEYSAGDFVSSIVEELISLYPGYDAFFDENGNFAAKMIPTCADDDIILNNDEIQSLLIDEQCSTDLTKVRNIVHVRGKVFDVEWYTENVTDSESTYHAVMESYTKKDYSNGDMFAVKIPSDNSGEQYLQINSLEKILLYDENYDTGANHCSLKAGNVYVFKYGKTLVNDEPVKRFYLLGQWQAHALCVLTDRSDPDTESYFREKYQVDSLLLNVVPDSPYTIQKIGERIDVKSGNEYESISSDALALQRASYELYKDARLTDNITLTLASIIPWLDVYMKVSYRKKRTGGITVHHHDRFPLIFPMERRL